MICKVKDNGCLITPLSILRLYAAKRRPVGICKLEKLHDRLPPHYHQRRTSRGHIENLARYASPGLHGGIDLYGTDGVYSSLGAAGRGAPFTTD